ncbi:hypothetical protein HDU77_010995 [Chytriomyces hyalinus]|nr:hypothetical protein HDU77_010995 [Chytriomyces hyalinus]
MNSSSLSHPARVSRKGLPVSATPPNTSSTASANALDTLTLAVANGSLNIAQRALGHVVSSGRGDSVDTDLLFGVMRLIGGTNLSSASADYRMSNSSNANDTSSSDSTLEICLRLLQTYHQNTSMPPDIVHLMLKRSADNGDSRQFDTLWSNCKAASNSVPLLPSSTYTMIMEAYSQRGLLKRVVEVFDCFDTAAAESAVIAEQSNSSPVTAPLDETAYFILIDAHLNQSPPDLNAALNIFHKMAIRANPSPSLPIFNRIIHAAGIKRDFETANLLLSMLQPANLRPNHNTYNVLIDAYAKAGDDANTQRVLLEWREDVMERARTPVRGESKLLPPTVVTYNTLMSMLAKSNSASAPEDADALLKIMTQDGGCGVNQVTVTSYLDVFKRRGLYAKVREAFYLFETAYGVPPSTPAYNVLLSCYGFSHDTITMRKIVDEMRLEKRLHLSQVSYRILVRAFASALDVNGVLEWMKDLSHAASTAIGRKEKLKLEVAMVESLAWASVKKEKFKNSKKQRVADVLKTHLDAVQALNNNVPFCSTALADTRLEALVADLRMDDEPVAFDMGALLEDAGFFADSSHVTPSATTLKLVVEVLKNKLDSGALETEASRISALESLKRVNGSLTVSGDLKKRVKLLMRELEK